MRIRGPRFGIAERVRHEAEGSHAVHRLFFTRFYAQAIRQHDDYPQVSVVAGTLFFPGIDLEHDQH